MRWGFWLAVTCVVAAGFYAVGAADDGPGNGDLDRDEAAVANHHWSLLKKPFRVRSAFGHGEHADNEDATGSGRVSWQHGVPRAAASAARNRYTRSTAPEARFAPDVPRTDDPGEFTSGVAAPAREAASPFLPASGALTDGRPLPPSLANRTAGRFGGQHTPIPDTSGTSTASEPRRLPLPADNEVFIDEIPAQPAAPTAVEEFDVPPRGASRATNPEGLMPAEHHAGDAVAAEIEPAEYRSDRTDPHGDAVRPAASIVEGEDSGTPVLLLGPPPATDSTPDPAPSIDEAAAQPQQKPNVSFTPLPGIAAGESADTDRLFPTAPSEEGQTLPQGTNGQQPQITLHWEAVGAINVGQQATLRLRVKNTGQGDAHDVEIQAFFPVSVRLTAATPQPAAATDRLVWKLESLPAGEEKVFEIELVPAERGRLAPSAIVRYSATAAGAFTVREPMLKLAVRGPQKVMMGDPASQVAIIGNPGTGAAENVTLEVRVPDGLEHPRGKHLVLELGTLNPGETRTVRLSLVAVSGGTQTLDLVATADGGLKQAERVAVSVIAPQLQLAVKGPSIRYLGRTAEYAVTVHNGGQAPSNNIQIVYQVPEGFRFVAADRGAHYDSGERTVHWFLGRLEPDASATVHVRLVAAKLGDYVHRVRAASEHGISAQAETTSRVDGTASLILEVVDLDDPVEVGAETAYEVRVRNEGSKAASNVGIACELPAGLQLVDVKGPTDHLTENGLIVFKPLGSLAPKQAATFRIRVRATQAGDQRFRVRLTSDSIQEPLLVEELTKFYQD